MDAMHPVAKIDEAGLAKLFRIVVGRQDSVTQIYPRRISLRLDDIGDLNKKISHKLAQYECETSFSANVTVSHAKTLQFGSLASFVSHDWKTPDETKVLTLRWSCLVKLPADEAPKLHSVLVRVSEGMTPLQMMRAVLSKPSDELETTDIEQSSPTICTVDFTDQLLSQELLKIVTDWNSALPEPAPVFPLLLKLQKRSASIHRVIEIAVPVITLVFGVALYTSKFGSTVSAAPASSQMLYELWIWFLGIFIFVLLTANIGHWLGSLAERSLDRMVRFSVFEITSGDRNRQNRLAARSQKSAWQFVATMIFTGAWKAVEVFLSVRWLH